MSQNALVSFETYNSEFSLFEPENTIILLLTYHNITKQVLHEYRKEYNLVYLYKS